MAWAVRASPRASVALSLRWTRAPSRWRSLDKRREGDYRVTIAKLGEVWVSSGLVTLVTRILAREVTGPPPVQS